MSFGVVDHQRESKEHGDYCEHLDQRTLQLEGGDDTVAIEVEGIVFLEPLIALHRGLIIVAGLLFPLFKLKHLKSGLKI